MPLDMQAKQSLVERYKEGVSAAPHVFLIDYKGISVPEVTELRRQIREQGGSYVVVKNRILLRALEGSALEALRDQLQGPIAAVFSDDDPVGLAKTLTEFAKTTPVLEFKGALVEGRQVAAEEIEAIAQLPSREELIAKLLFLLQSPISRFATALAAIPRQLVVALEQIRQKKEAAG